MTAYNYLVVGTFVLVCVLISYASSINSKLDKLDKNLSEFIEPITDLPDIDENNGNVR